MLANKGRQRPHCGNERVILVFDQSQPNEGGGMVKSMEWETMSTCHCVYKPGLQTVDHYKFLDARRMTSVRDRWSLSHTDAFQYSLFNGVDFILRRRWRTSCVVSCRVPKHAHDFVER